MNNIILKTLGSLSLQTISIISIICGAIGLICVTLLIYTRHKLLTAAYVESENDNVEIVTVSNDTMTMYDKLNKRFNRIMLPAALFCLLTIAFVTVYSYYNNLALKYGAYGNGQHIQTLNEINDCTLVNGFLDQSKELPDDLSGCIIIYIKYGCPDCRSIHDEIVNCIQDNDVNNIYFVSTRSEKGSQLLELYPVNEVPTGVYIRKKDSTISNRFTEVLYGHIYDDENNEVVYFEKDKMLSLIEHQKNGD